MELIFDNAVDAIKCLSAFLRAGRVAHLKAITQVRFTVTCAD